MYERFFAEFGSARVHQRSEGEVEVQDLLDNLEANMSPSSVRDLAATILRLADSIDQNWDPGLRRSNYPVFSRAARIERNALSLSFAATKEEYRAKFRDEALGGDLVGIPAWNMLLELFKQFSGGARVSTKSLQIIARCPETTALRIIDKLEDRGLVIRIPSDTDRRVTFVALSREGLAKVGSVLERFGS
ncbi:MarR family transcriptional regulator [Erythrobacter donghaensis]|uniref:MarR family transcriptional regulator n=1 Tax=Erythrobacter donghaensis TaxID=267135 RepID=UPI00093C8AFD|nr:MarR family transcriptional regulator [Erythrobacter donghaensis]